MLVAANDVTITPSLLVEGALDLDRCPEQPLGIEALLPGVHARHHVSSSR